MPSIVILTCLSLHLTRGYVIDMGWAFPLVGGYFTLVNCWSALVGVLDHLVVIFLFQRTNTLSVSIRSFSVSMRSFSVSIRSPNALIQRTNTLISASIRSPATLRRGRRGHAHSVLRRGRRGYAPTAYQYAPQRIHTLHSVFIRSTAQSYAHTALWRR